MENKQQNQQIIIQSLMAQNAILESMLADKIAEISGKEALLINKDILLAKNEAVLAEKESAITDLTANNEYLKFQLDQFRRMLFGSKRERFISTIDAQQLTLQFEPKTAEIEELVKAEREQLRIEYLRNKPKKKHQGRLALPSHLTVIEIHIQPTEDTTNMVCIGKEITDELDYTPAKLHVNRYIRPKYIAQADDNGNQKQVIAELNRPIPKCIASSELITSILVDKFVFHLPLHRIRLRFLKMGVDIPESTIGSWVKLASQLLLPLYAVHRECVKREIYQMVDESPIKVQDSNKPGACHLGYMWVRHAPLSKASVFEYYKSRSAQEPLHDLLTFKGYVQTDGYAGYTFLAWQQGIVHLSCWAHARRYFDKALDNDRERASHVLKLIQLLYAIEALAREKGLTHQERYELRLEKSLPIINEIGQYIQAEKNKVTPQSPIGKAFDYCANRWTSLQNYLTNGMLEIDSNLVENAIRPLALGRNNFLFGGSHEAAIFIAMHYSFFATCAKNNIDQAKWLNYVINHINDTKASQLKYLLPQYIDKNLLK